MKFERNKNWRKLYDLKKKIKIAILLKKLMRCPDGINHLQSNSMADSWFGGKTFQSTYFENYFTYQSNYFSIFEYFYSHSFVSPDPVFWMWWHGVNVHFFRTVHIEEMKKKILYEWMKFYFFFQYKHFTSSIVFKHTLFNKYISSITPMEWINILSINLIFKGACVW